MKNKFNRLRSGLDSLAVFASVRNDDVMIKFRRLLDAVCENNSDAHVALYGEFVAALYPHTSCLTEYVRELVLKDDNFYVKGIASGNEMSDEIQTAARTELGILHDLSSISSEDMKSAINYDGDLPRWTTCESDIAGDFAEKMENISRTGYGIFAQYAFFRLDDTQIVPVTHPDCRGIDELFEYERERALIMKNTQALIDGTGASNMLLYGDAGTGKSSTVKAVASHFAPDGLRIIEVKKNQLFRIPDLMEELSSNPLKFIIFIDDLSFVGNDDNFSALKATLEGSISGCGDNVVIYATSNRRHLVKESFAGRAGDEIHLNDTMQETMSLAARFGLTITFQKPDKEEYLSIVKSLAEINGIDIDEEELFAKAEAHAIRRNGRSPRTAKQFIELLKIGL